MMTLGQYETLAAAYNNTSTITYPIPASLPVGTTEVINEDGLQMNITNTADGVTEIRFDADANSSSGCTGCTLHLSALFWKPKIITTNTSWVITAQQLMTLSWILITT